MSYQLAFWAYPDGRRSNRVADRRTYLKLIKGRRAKDVAPLDTDRVLDELSIVYGTWRRTDTYHFSHPSHGSFDVWITGGTFVVLTFHNVKDLTDIVSRSARCLGLDMTEDGALEVARRSRGTPRIANRLLRRVRDFAQVKSDGRIDGPISARAMDMLDVDNEGFDFMDRKLLLAVIDKFMGGPVGLDNLAAAIGEEKDTIEDVLEPYLIQQGYLQRTPRGRIATQRAYAHFGLERPADQ